MLKKYYWNTEFLIKYVLFEYINIIYFMPFDGEPLKMFYLNTIFRQVMIILYTVYIISIGHQFHFSIIYTFFIKNKK